MSFTTDLIRRTDPKVTMLRKLADVEGMSNEATQHPMPEPTPAPPVQQSSGRAGKSTPLPGAALPPKPQAGPSINQAPPASRMATRQATHMGRVARKGFGGLVSAVAPYAVKALVPAAVAGTTAAAMSDHLNPLDAAGTAIKGGYNTIKDTASALVTPPAAPAPAAKPASFWDHPVDNTNKAIGDAVGGMLPEGANEWVNKNIPGGYTGGIAGIGAAGLLYHLLSKKNKHDDEE